MRIYTFYSLLLGASIVLLDQLVKLWALSITRIPVWGDAIGFQYAENRGVAFSFPIEGPLLQLITIVFIALIFWWSLKEKAYQHPWLWLPFTCILGGAFGNAIDRFFRGFVVDMFQVGSFPIFNVADSFVTIGVGLLIVFEFSKTIKSN